LLHEAELPPDIQFEDRGAAKYFLAGGAPEYVLKIGTGWFEYMIQCALKGQSNERKNLQ
jgi:hypothetical protein